MKEKGRAVKLGDSTEKADWYMECLINSNKYGASNFLQVSEKGEVILHISEKPQE